MDAIVLAAGLGSRLQEMTRELPKALVPVAGRTLIDYAIHFARRAGAEKLVVVGGFYAEDVAAEVKRIDAKAVMADNPDYRLGNLLSLVAGIRHIASDRDLLLMNTDHIYRPAIADIVRAATESAERVTAFCDFDRKLGADDMKVALTPERDGHRYVTDMEKSLQAWDAGYVGMTYVPSQCQGEYRSAIEATTRTRGGGAVVEQVLVTLALHSATQPAIADISGHGWLEVDEPHERDLAEQTLSEDAWWD